MRIVWVAIALLGFLLGCRQSPAVPAPQNSKESSAESAVVEDDLIEGMVPEMDSPTQPVETQSIDTAELLEQLRTSLKQYPHQAKWKAGSNINWATFTVDFGDEFPENSQVAFDTVWAQWTTPECELTRSEGSQSLKQAIRSTIEEGFSKGEAERSVVFRGFKFYLLFHRNSGRNAGNLFELQFLNAQAAAEAGE